VSDEWPYGIVSSSSAASAAIDEARVWAPDFITRFEAIGMQAMSAMTPIAKMTIANMISMSVNPAWGRVGRALALGRATGEVRREKLMGGSRLPPTRPAACPGGSGGWRL
jgi:hypothetical protein